MGWTEVHKEPCSYRDYFNEGLKGSIIDSHTEKGVFYGALRHEKGVYALVILVRPQKGYFNLSYKWMDESFHPYYYDCPDRILDLLTPTESKGANEWRSICRERNKRKKQVKKGTVIKFTEPIHFTNGIVRDTFQYAGGNRFQYAGYYFNIRNWISREFTVLM
jgi:hypothetical protein